MKRVSLTVAMAALAGTFAASGAQAQVNHPTTAPQVHTNAVRSRLSLVIPALLYRTSFLIHRQIYDLQQMIS